MNYKDFLEYLRTNLDGYETFINKAMQFQIQQNLKRPAKSRWDDERMQKAVGDMWRKSMEPLYSNLKKEVQSDNQASWITFIEKNNIFETVNDGINEIDFSGDVA